MANLDTINPHPVLYTLIRGLLYLAVDDILSNDSVCSIALDNLIIENDGLLHQIVEKKWIVGYRWTSNKKECMHKSLVETESSHEMMHLPHVLRRVLQLLCLRSHIRQDIRSLMYDRQQLKHLASPSFGVSLRSVASILRAEKEVPCTVRKWSASVLSRFIEKNAWFWNNGTNHSVSSSYNEVSSEEEYKEQEQFLLTIFEPQLTSILGRIAISYVITSPRNVDPTQSSISTDTRERNSGSIRREKCSQLYKALLSELIETISRRVLRQDGCCEMIPQKQLYCGSSGGIVTSTSSDNTTREVEEEKVKHDDKNFSPVSPSPMSPRRRILHTISPPMDILAEQFYSSRLSQGSEDREIARVSVLNDSFIVGVSTDDSPAPLPSRNIIPSSSSSRVADVFPTPPHGQMGSTPGQTKSKNHGKRRRDQPVVLLGLSDEEGVITDNAPGGIDKAERNKLVRYYTLDGKSRSFERIGESDRA